MPTTLIFGASRGLGRAFTTTHFNRATGSCPGAHADMASELHTLGVEVVIGDALDPQAVAQACRLAGQGCPGSLHPRQLSPECTGGLSGQSAM
jgi:hypothetical protein